MTTEPNTPEHADEDHEAHAGGPVDDGFPQRADRTPPPADNDEAPPRISDPVTSAAKTQRPEEDEFGLRATQSGDPDGEDRPNGDPRTVGHPVGGGERSPDVSADSDSDDDQAARTAEDRG